jgi:hypothetical protein
MNNQTQYFWCEPKFGDVAAADVRRDPTVFLVGFFGIFFFSSVLLFCLLWCSMFSSKVRRYWPNETFTWSEKNKKYNMVCDMEDLRREFWEHEKNKRFIDFMNAHAAESKEELNELVGDCTRLRDVMEQQQQRPKGAIAIVASAPDYHAL